MASSTRSAATERAYLQFSRGAAATGTDEEFDESDIWGASTPAPAPDPAAAATTEKRLLAPAVPAAARKAKAAPPVADRAAAHGSLPMKIPDWSKILGDEYRDHHTAAAGDWDLDDDDVVVDAAGAVVPPHELAWRRRATSLSVHQGAGVVGRTLKVRDAVWKRTTGFQD